ncbi:hypothetical protein GCM10023116_31240 [Kistimonas scapharcae]|uniref:Uncharacterized protein n=1 Tax=Kistimonas scapharcae TaxID=1036133 RepID=A0ABP8V6C5_9GAMM
MTESMNKNSVERACVKEASTDAYYINTHSVRPSLLELTLLALFESGFSGLRQEQVYPPQGLLLSTGDRFITGNLRNQVCELRKKEIHIIDWVDPYHLKDGRVMYFKRYAYPCIRSGIHAFRMMNRYRLARGVPQILLKNVLRLFLFT